MAQSVVDTHGLKMINLRKVAGLVSGVSRWSQYRVQIGWDPSDGRIIFEEFVGDNSWVVWSDGVIGCGTLVPGMTQQQIADQIYDSVRAFYEVEGERS